MSNENGQSSAPTASRCSSLVAAVERMRVADSYGIEWGNLLRDANTDPQMVSDVVAIVRAYLHDETARQVSDCALLIARLVHQVRRHDPENEIATKAMDYLRRKEIMPSILRGVM